uniref:Septin-type G domain-containing protein n=1 Tax=Phocoena sinus TaxID=42100 RepID=A0A8C9CAD1_PHOSS
SCNLRYAWGIAEVKSGEHWDLTILRDMLLRTHMQDLKDVIGNVRYENYRSRKPAAVTYDAVDNNKNKRQLPKSLLLFPINFILFFLMKKIYYLFRLCWVFIAVHGLSLVAVSRGYSSLQRVGFSLRWLLMWSTGSRRVGFSSCGTRTLGCGGFSSGGTWAQ